MCKVIVSHISVTSRFGGGNRSNSYKDRGVFLWGMGDSSVRGKRERGRGPLVVRRNLYRKTQTEERELCYNRSK